MSICLKSALFYIVLFLLVFCQSIKIDKVNKQIISNSVEDLNLIKITDFITNYCTLSASNKNNCEVFGLKLKLNKFAYISQNEFEDNYLNYLNYSPLTVNPDFSNILLKKNIIPSLLIQTKNDDTSFQHTTLRKQVADLGKCTASWAQSSLEASEAAYQNSYKLSEPIKFSLQELIDCVSTTLGVDATCKSGLSVYGFSYYINNNQSVRESAYSYTQAKSSCKISKLKNDQFVQKPIFDFHYYDNITIADLKALVKINPVVVNINASSQEFIYYSDGILTVDCQSKKPNLYVVIYGYGVQDGINYWLVKNTSWGANWGQNGLFKILMKDDYDSCGIYTKLSVPVGY
jgi:hypothetical protein